MTERSPMAVPESPFSSEGLTKKGELKQETSLPSSLDFLAHLPPPPPAILWITVLVALGTLLWRIVVFIVERFDKRRERDEYWYRAIVFPLCVEPLLKHVNALTDKIRPLAAERDEAKRHGAYMAFLHESKIENDKTINRFLVLSAKDQATYQAVSSTLDEVDDIITQHCACNALGAETYNNSREYENPTLAEQAIFSKLRELLENLRTLHRKAFRS